VDFPKLICPISLTGIDNEEVYLEAGGKVIGQKGKR